MGDQSVTEMTSLRSIRSDVGLLSHFQEKLLAQINHKNAVVAVREHRIFEGRGDFYELFVSCIYSGHSSPKQLSPYVHYSKCLCRLRILGKCRRRNSRPLNIFRHALQHKS